MIGHKWLAYLHLISASVKETWTCNILFALCRIHCKFNAMKMKIVTATRKCHLKKSFEIKCHTRIPSNVAIAPPRECPTTRTSYPKHSPPTPSKEEKRPVDSDPAHPFPLPWVCQHENYMVIISLTVVKWKEYKEAEGERAQWPNFQDQIA